MEWEEDGPSNRGLCLGLLEEPQSQGLCVTEGEKESGPG